MIMCSCVPERRFTSTGSFQSFATRIAFSVLCAQCCRFRFEFRTVDVIFYCNLRRKGGLLLVLMLNRADDDIRNCSGVR